MDISNFVDNYYDLLVSKEESVNEWVKAHIRKLKLPIYSSHDIRNSGFKISAVDANLFPSGFNNLCKNSRKISSKYFKRYINDNFTRAKNILIIAEKHTRNKYYLENLSSLASILSDAGYEVKAGVLLDEEVEKEILVDIRKKYNLEIYPIEISDRTLKVEGFIPDLVISNNDFSGKKPSNLMSVSQPIAPTIELGWFRRKKSNHFRYYCHLVKEFAETFGLDSWLLSSFFHYVDGIDFFTKKNFNKAAEKVDNIIDLIKKKYRYYGIEEKPFVFIKNNSGTYGMAVMTAESGEDFLNMNRSTRLKMSYGKSASTVNSLIIQEGIPTIDKVNDFVAEPLIYFVGENPVGGFFRLNTQKTTKENLNTKGMFFDSDNLCPMSSEYRGDDIKSNVSAENIKVYEFTGFLSVIAQGYETAEVERKRD